MMTIIQRGIRFRVVIVFNSFPWKKTTTSDLCAIQLVFCFSPPSRAHHQNNCHLQHLPRWVILRCYLKSIQIISLSQHMTSRAQLVYMLHAAMISECLRRWFFTYDDASSDTEADGHAEACSLVTTLLCGRHVFIDSLKIKGVDQPSSEWKQKAVTPDQNTVSNVLWLNISFILLDMGTSGYKFSLSLTLPCYKLIPMQLRQWWPPQCHRSLPAWRAGYGCHMCPGSSGASPWKAKRDKE